MKIEEYIAANPPPPGYKLIDVVHRRDERTGWVQTIHRPNWDEENVTPNELVFTPAAPP